MTLLLVDFLYRDSKWRYWVLAVGAAVYVFSSELLHNMGIVYWAHSLMQVTLPLQLLLYLHGRRSKDAKIAFYILCVLNPYIEWTGYVANAGYFLAEAFGAMKSRSGWKAFAPCAFIALFTLLSGGLFTLHYLSVISKDEFVTALKNRFQARNFTTSASVRALLEGYCQSFLFFWWLLAALIATACALYRGFGWVRAGQLANYPVVLFLSLFPLLENIVMKQHAIQYAFDRMKMAFPLVLIFADLFFVILKKTSSHAVRAALPCVLALVCAYNFACYVTDSHYVWDAPFLRDNETFAETLNERFPDSVMGWRSATRGYINLLFRRGVYEGLRWNP